MTGKIDLHLTLLGIVLSVVIAVGMITAFAYQPAQGSSHSHGTSVCHSGSACEGAG